MRAVGLASGMPCRSRAPWMGRAALAPGEPRGGCDAGRASRPGQRARNHPGGDGVKLDRTTGREPHGPVRRAGPGTRAGSRAGAGDRPGGLQRGHRRWRARPEPPRPLRRPPPPRSRLLQPHHPRWPLLQRGRRPRTRPPLRPILRSRNRSSPVRRRHPRPPTIPRHPRQKKPRSQWPRPRPCSTTPTT